MKQLPEHEIDGLRFFMTTGAFPEQYDVFLADEKVGYLRYRHGFFSVECPDCGDNLVYEEEIEGQQGIFTKEDRERCLHKAAAVIRNWLDAHRDQARQSS